MGREAISARLNTVLVSQTFGKRYKYQVLNAHEIFSLGYKTELYFGDTEI